VLEQYPKEVKLVYKQFPLQMHKFAAKASAGCLAAGEQGKYWEFHEEVFKNQKSLNDDTLKKIAKSLDLDMNKFNKDISSPRILDLINQDVSEGFRDGVRGTPTIFINGRMLENRSIQGFKQAIDSELK